MIYLHYDPETGAVLGAYHDSVSDIPLPNVPVEDSVWQTNMEAERICVVQDGVPVFMDDPEPPEPVHDNPYILSDYDRTKIDSVQVGAEVNRIEHIIVNDGELPVVPDRSVSFSTGTYWLESH